MEPEIINIRNDILKMRKDIEFIKMLLMCEGELSDYAKIELAKARKEGEDSYTSLEEL